VLSVLALAGLTGSMRAEQVRIGVCVPHYCDDYGEWLDDLAEAVEESGRVSAC
jgi:hypothetical protein